MMAQISEDPDVNLVYEDLFREDGSEIYLKPAWLYFENLPAELSFADIEKNIKTISEKAREGKLNIEDLQGGTFTISNGGVYGSMLSTPILNLPQFGVLGMHNIVDRPIALDGEIKIRPIMYLALSYDHRIIDGKESVSFLKMIKENLEDPRRLFLNIKWQINFKQ